MAADENDERGNEADPSASQDLKATTKLTREQLNSLLEQKRAAEAREAEAAQEAENPPDGGSAADLRPEPPSD